MIIEALGLYVQYGSPTNTIPNPIQPEINWAAKWEQWFAECEAMPIPTTTQPPQNEYTALLIDKYRKQGGKL